MTATNATFTGIYRVAINPSKDKLYVADLGNKRIRVLDLKTSLVDTVAGNGKKGVPDDGAMARSELELEVLLAFAGVMIKALWRGHRGFLSYPQLSRLVLVTPQIEYNPCPMVDPCRMSSWRQHKDDTFNPRRKLMNCIPNTSTASVRGAVVLVGASVGHLFLPILFLLLGAWSGCGSKDPFPLARVQGTVSYQGRPLELGRVVFIPVHGTPGPQAVGKIEPDGSFRMSTANREGAAIGEHVVTVHCRREPTTEEARNLVITESLIPLRYAREDKTPLSFQVEDGRNELPIALE